MLNITSHTIDTINNDKIIYYTLNSKKLIVDIINYGAIITSIKVLDANNLFTDIVLGYPSIKGYLNDFSTFMGSIPARYANRIANSNFTLQNKNYQLLQNENGNTLHGGPLNHIIWESKIIETKLKKGIQLTHISKNGYWGFPGNLNIKVNYLIDKNANLYMEYYATCDKPTIINLTNHSYFNLDGENSGTIINQSLNINAYYVTYNNKYHIPIGTFNHVHETPFDFTSMRKIGAGINSSHEQIVLGNGYDINYIINREHNSYPDNSSPALPEQMYFMAKAQSAGSKNITMEVYSTQKGLQFYTGNYLNTIEGKTHHKYGPRHGFCLETQAFPNSPNNPNFPDTSLLPDSYYHQETIFSFSK